MKKLILFSFLVSEKLFAACGLTLTASNVTIDWDLNFTSIAIQVRIDKSGADACDFGLGITKGGAASYAARRAAVGAKLISYGIYSDTGLTTTVKDVPDIGSSSDVIQGGFQTGTNLTQNIIYYLQIPYNLATTPTLVSAGAYTDSFNLDLYEGSTPTAFVTPVDTKTIALTINVPKLIRLSFVDSGGSFNTNNTTRNVSFGMLTEGTSAAFDLRLRTNAGYSVTFSSTNNGSFHHTKPGATATVPYLFYLNGALLSLAGSSGTPVVGLTGPGQTPLNGLGYPLRIIVGSTPADALGGAYSDSMTVTATTTE